MNTEAKAARPEVGMTTLLEKARFIRTPRRTRMELTEEDLELALAWVTGETTLMQATRAWGYNSTNATYGRLVVCLREAVKQGRLKVSGPASPLALAEVSRRAS
jgi:hypothetical protein